MYNNIAGMWYAIDQLSQLDLLQNEVLTGDDHRCYIVDRMLPQAISNYAKGCSRSFYHPDHHITVHRYIILTLHMHGNVQNMCVTTSMYVYSSISVLGLQSLSAYKYTLYYTFNNCIALPSGVMQHLTRANTVQHLHPSPKLEPLAVAAQLSGDLFKVIR